MTLATSSWLTSRRYDCNGEHIPGLSFVAVVSLFVMDHYMRYMRLHSTGQSCKNYKPRWIFISEDISIENKCFSRKHVVRQELILPSVSVWGRMLLKDLVLDWGIIILKPRR